MLVGDPFQFAINLEVVDEWNIDNTFNNGIMLFFIDGYIFPNNELINITLNFAVNELKENFSNIPINNDIYNMSAKDALIKIYHKVYDDEDYRYKITPQEIADKNYFIFAVSNGENIRILATEMEYITKNSTHKHNNTLIRESIVSLKVIEKIISKLSI